VFLSQTGLSCVVSLVFSKGVTYLETMDWTGKRSRAGFVGLLCFVLAARCDR
jgi:hypothetical protein